MLEILKLEINQADNIKFIIKYFNNTKIIFINLIIIIINKLLPTCCKFVTTRNKWRRRTPFFRTPFFECIFKLISKET